MFTQEETRRLLDIANYGSHKGRYEARRIFESILTLQPEHSGALLGLAHSHITVNEFDKAEEILQNVLAKNNEDMDAKVLLALSYFLSDKKEEAKPLLEEAAKKECASWELAKNLLANY